mgnify:CR=1 FL=1
MGERAGALGEIDAVFPSRDVLIPAVGHVIHLNRDNAGENQEKEEIFAFLDELKQAFRNFCLENGL